MQGDEADRREGCHRYQRERTEFARDAAIGGGRVELTGRDRGQFSRRRFQLPRDGYGTSITWTIMKGRLPTFCMK
jgi:hypothetical protein